MHRKFDQSLRDHGGPFQSRAGVCTDSLHCRPQAFFPGRVSQRPVSPAASTPAPWRWGPCTSPLSGAPLPPSVSPARGRGTPAPWFLVPELAGGLGWPDLTGLRVKADFRVGGGLREKGGPSQPPGRCLQIAERQTEILRRWSSCLLAELGRPKCGGQGVRHSGRR